MVLIKNCLTLTRTILLSRNNANLHVKVNYSQDIKPYLYKWRAKKNVPTTEEEVKDVAGKYNLHPREYKAYEPDGFGFGDYPKLPYIGGDAKDSNYPWDFPEFKRNFNEPVHIEEDQIGEDRYAAGVRTPLSGLEVVTMFVGTMTILGIFYWIFEYYPWFQCVMEKQYPKADVINDTIITNEEKEALDRSSESDSQCFLNTCENIRKAMSKIAKLKASSDPNAEDEVHELQIQTSLAFIELKKLNRMEKFRTKFARDSLVTAKSSVDSKHLHLQNLLYEVMHLKKEVIKCLQFKSKDELIQLVSEEEFYKEAPESICRPEITKVNPHQLRLARLEWELTQRKQLAALCDELTESKKAVTVDMESKQTRLDNLAPQLLTILEASKPLQESLGLPLDKVRQEHQKAALLASPLYVLYAKATAYRDAYDNTLIIKVEGDEDEAKRTNNQDGLQESDSDPETQLENIVEETPVHKKRHHRLSREARQEEKRLKLLQRHPLNVTLVISLKSETKLTLQFFYMIHLKVVTVESKLETDVSGGISAGDMLVSESVLRELYPNDLGIESPNPANHYQLARHNLGLFSTLGLGIPYRWAQRMAGLHFISANSHDQKLTVQESTQDSVVSVLKEIKRRVKARLELCREIRRLESGNLPIFVNTVDPLPQKITTILYRFTTMTWKNYSNYANVPICREGLVSAVDIFYEAVLRRGSSELIARIAIKPDYPKVAALFSISISPMVPASADILRDIEREVNVMWTKPPTISAQLQRLRACFDIYLETESMAPKEKIFFHPVKGRTRARPYKYLTLGGGIFTHR